MKILHKIERWRTDITHSALGKQVDKSIQFYKCHMFIVQCILIIAYRICLDITYLKSVSPSYAYSGFTTGIIPILYLLSWLVVMVCMPLSIRIFQQEDCPSSIMVSVLNFLYFIPMTSLLGCRGSDVQFMVIVFLYWLFLLGYQFFIPTITLNKLSNTHSDQIFRILTIFSVILVMGISGYYTGFRLHFNIIDVYGVRSEAATYDIPQILNYCLSMMTITLSILIIYWIRQRKWIVVFLLLVVYMFYFSIGAHKSTIFMLMLILICYFLFRKGIYRIVPILMSALVLGCFLIHKITGWVIPMSLFVRRTMYVPVLLSQTYYEFFLQYPLNLFRNGILEKFGFDPLYSDQVVRIIGEFNASGANANNGLIGDMCANLPWGIGLIIMPLIIVLCFRLFDMTAKELPKKYSIAFLVFFANVFCNSSWSTVLLTHGFLLTCILFYIFPAEKETIK